MDLVKAMEFLQNSAEPNLVEHAGDRFTDKQLHRLPNYKYPKALEISTLSSLVDYIKSDVDFVKNDEEQYLIVIDGPDQVRLVSHLDDDENRRHLLTAKAVLPDYSFNRYIPREQFQIALQSKFEVSDDRSVLLDFISRVQSGSIAEYGDDGVSQKVTISKGAKGLQDIIIPSPVKLSPYRTFVDINQPDSEFVFRMQDTDRNGVECGLWEADGGYWRVIAVSEIKMTLTVALEGLLDKFIIIG